jgi:hypothetical protein
MNRHPLMPLARVQSLNRHLLSTFKPPATSTYGRAAASMSVLPASGLRGVLGLTLSSPMSSRELSSGPSDDFSAPKNTSDDFRHTVELT